ncbi:MAG: hypothetical protein HPM95_12810 [Alphaproteobacteria bacterium]|nr:hypothetical protein [Alphaproteobacteria bacterium]
MAEPTPALSETLRQIETLDASERPLVVCDVDEVALHFIAHLEDHLESLGLAFLSHDYKLTGNISRPQWRAIARRRDQGSAANLLRHLDAQAAACGGRAAAAPPVAGRRHRVPDQSAGAWNQDTRARTLSQHGMQYPVITNTGPKGGAVAALRPGALDRSCSSTTAPEHPLRSDNSGRLHP